MGKTVFIYDQNSGELHGAYECQESPLEAGVYIVPSASTDIEPPSFVQGKVTLWDSGSWVQVDDVRGLWYDQQTGDAVEITDIHADVSQLSRDKPPPTDAQMAILERAKRDRLLAEADYLVNEAEDNGQPTQLLRTYRKALRDVPQQQGFPRSIVWPTKP